MFKEFSSLFNAVSILDAVVLQNWTFGGKQLSFNFTGIMTDMVMQLADKLYESIC